MNHYERLKITPDAPPAVVCAAYRALSEMLGADDPHRQPQQSALNEAYEVLRDEVRRAQYDQDLALARGDVDVALTGDGLDEAAGQLDALGPHVALAVTHDEGPTAYDLDSHTAPRTKHRLTVVACVLGAGVLVAGAGYVWNRAQNVEHISQTLSQELLHEAAAPASAWEPAVAEVDPLDYLTVDDLETMTDEELVATLAKVSGAGKAATSAAATPAVGRSALPHHLDGDALGLRQDLHLPRP